MRAARMREIRIKADEFRENCKVIRYSIIDLFSECERMGYRVIRYPIGESGILGFVQIRDHEKIIFSNSSARLSREIFSIAHEIGHILLHISEHSTVFIDPLENLSNETQDIVEQEANYFAACLLMPADEVKKYIDYVMNNKELENWTAFDIAQMMTAFNVSFETAVNRLVNLKIIGSSVRMRLDNEKNKIKVTRLLKILGGNSRLNVATEEKKIPGEYLKWVVDNYNHKVIPKETLERALDFFDVTVEDIADEICVKEETEEDLDDLIGRLPD